MRLTHIPRLFSLLFIFSFFFFVAVLFVPKAHGVGKNIVNVDFPCSENSVMGECVTQDSGSKDFSLYIKRFYQFAAGIAGVLAVGMIVIGSFYYSVSGVVDKKAEGKDMIVSALWGIALIFGSYFILNTINPELVRLKKPGNIETLVSPCPRGEVASGTKPLADGETGPAQINCVKIVDLTTEGSCGDPAKMTVFKENPDREMRDCGTRKIIYPMGYEPEISNSLGGVNKYYTESEVIDADSDRSAKVWVYPYYIESIGISSAKCLIYAYKQGEEDEEVKMVDLNSTLKLCPNVTQNTSESCTEDSTVPSDTYSTHDEAQKALSPGITTRSSGDNCTERCNKKCTSLKGIPKDTITKINLIKEKCSGCAITITGGTEIGHQTHGMGQSVLDFAWDLNLAKCFKDGTGCSDASNSLPSYVCTSLENALYRKGGCEWDEKENHLHARF